MLDHREANQTLGKTAEPCLHLSEHVRLCFSQLTLKEESHPFMGGSVKQTGEDFSRLIEALNIGQNVAQTKPGPLLL